MHEPQCHEAASAKAVKAVQLSAEESVGHRAFLIRGGCSPDTNNASQPSNTKIGASVCVSCAWQTAAHKVCALWQLMPRLRPAVFATEAILNCFLTVFFVSAGFVPVLFVSGFSCFSFVLHALPYVAGA